jgi:1,4-alpha-glucan branching enzyme
MSDKSIITDYDIYLFKKGAHYGLYEKMGAHPASFAGQKGYFFSVWAPNASEVSLIGDFNGWDPKTSSLSCRKDGSGIWEIFMPGIQSGSLYKYHIKTKSKKKSLEKSDPFAFFCEKSPKTASVTYDIRYKWDDAQWMEQRKERNSLQAPISVYEVHLGSWQRDPAGQFLNYREYAPKLADYVKKMGFTHIELLPIMEHPFYGSWGYQVTGFFAPTSRYGTPEDFMFFMDTMHQNAIGVILDWVPSHFPDDSHGLAMFDGTCLYEHEDKRLGYHPDWKSLIFNYGRYEVKQFLINNALFWLDKYHIDAIRIDAVASMLYLDYSRKEGEWLPNKYGGRENLEAIDFLRQLNEQVYKRFDDVQTMAEESTAWPMVTKPPYVGGLGFGIKWNMGWMHDTLEYFAKDPVYRKHHQNELNFTFWYAFNENFILPLSHDEVVYGKKSLLEKMPGDRWQKFANIRLLLSLMFAYPGKKLLFMGNEFAQSAEWHHEASLDWELTKDGMHGAVMQMTADLNRIYRAQKAFYLSDFHSDGFDWIDFSDYENTVFSFSRKADTDLIVAVFNFTPVPRTSYRLGVDEGGTWDEIFNSDAGIYGGSGFGNLGKVKAQKSKSHARDYSISINLPPLGALFFKKTSKSK